jgi:hypothetical protein
MLSNLDTFANFIQILSYQELLEQATADDVLQELQHQNKAYLEQILNMQKEILTRLERLENERTIKTNQTGKSRF